ncbi:MAG: AAA family ATPase [Acidobacteria bacterium]|nr:AAA family ATPase [Acidobacteriota bacterium]
METTLQILLVGADPALPSELQAALSAVPNFRAVLHTATNFHEAIEIAMNRNPHLICVQMERDVRDLRAFAREVNQALPRTMVAALYRPDQWSTNELESSVIIDLLRSQVQDFLRRPLASTELRPLLDRLFRPRTASTSAIGKVVSFVSNKGGVGKSTLAVNAACALAKRHPGRVLLIDASLQLGVCAIMLDLAPQATLVDAVRERERIDESLLRRLTVSHECGLDLLAAPPDAVAAADVDDASLARVISLARRAYSYVVVDTFPVLDSAVISILDLSDSTYIVLQGIAGSFAGALKLLPVLEAINFPRERQRLVLNRNYARFAGHLDQRDMEERLGRAIDFTFPYRKGILAAANAGRPYILGATRWFGYGHAMAAMVSDIEDVAGMQVESESTTAPLARKATA